jgi:hypothetical protein
VQVAEQRPYGGWQPGGPVREQRLPGADGVLGDDERRPAEPFGQQARQRGGPTGHRMAHIHGAQLRGAVPPRGQRAQHTLQLVGDDEQLRHHDIREHRTHAGGPARRLQLDERLVPPQQRGERARTLLREIRQRVQPAGETVRPPPRPRAGQRPGEFPEPLTKGTPRRPSTPERPPGGRPPQPLLPHPAHMRRGPDEARRLCPGGTAQGVHVELVTGQATHEAVAPGASLTPRVRVATLGK